MLINCVAYRDGKKIGNITIDKISDCLADPANFVWVGLKDASDAELETMREEFGLHELAVEDARRGHQRPKLEEYGESLFVVLRTLEFNEKNKLQGGEVSIFVGRNFVLSIRNNSKQSFVNVRERCEREPHLLKHGSAYVLYALMDSVVDRYFPIVEKLENELELIEERIFSKSASSRVNIEKLYALKQKMIAMQHATVSMAEAVGKLHGGRVPEICHSMQDYFRDVSDHIIRINRAIESIREMTGTAVQVNLSFIALGESEVTKKLASYGALFAAPTAIAGIYGMNFKSMPELEWSLGYPLALGLMIVTNFVLWRLFKRSGWL